MKYSLQKRQLLLRRFCSETEGFEPSCPGEQTHFECARYDRFDTSPKFLTFALYHTVPNLQALTANLFRDEAIIKSKFNKTANNSKEEMR